MTIELNWVPEERPHFPGCDFVCKGLMADPSFKFPCTCGQIYRQIQDDGAALAFLKEHPNMAYGNLAHGNPNTSAGEVVV